MPTAKAGTYRRKKSLAGRKKTKETVTIADLVRATHDIELLLISIRNSLEALDPCLPVPIKMPRTLSGILMKQGQC
jgi:hypothetical protein